MPGRWGASEILEGREKLAKRASALSVLAAVPEPARVVTLVPLLFTLTTRMRLLLESAT